MCLRVEWDNPEQTVIRYSINATHWTTEDLRLAIQHTWDMMKIVDHTVGVIFDVRGGGRDIPAGFLTLSRWIAENRPANAGRIVIVGGDSQMQAMYDVFRSTYKVFTHDFKLLFVDTMAEARQILTDQLAATI